MMCSAEARQRAQYVASIVQNHVHVAGVDIVAPSEDPTNRWLVDIALDARADGLADDLADHLVEHEMTIRKVDPQGSGWIVWAVC